jgi:hypothetical protein
LPQNLRRDLVNILTKSTTQDSSFGVVPAYTATQSSVPATIYIGVTSPQVQMIYAKRQQIVDSEIHFDATVTVNDGDLIQDQSTGISYVVLGFRQPTAPRYISIAWCAVYQGGE